MNLYQLNINHKKVHTLSYKYFSIEKINKKILNLSLFVINIGGNHIPTKRQIKIEKKIMEKKFPLQTEYEIISNKNYIKKYIKLFFYIFLIIFIILVIIKINIFFKYTIKS